MKIIFLFNTLLFKKEVLSDSSCHIYTHIYVVVEIIKAHSSVPFELSFDNDVI